MKVAGCKLFDVRVVPLGKHKGKPPEAKIGTGCFLKEIQRGTAGSVFEILMFPDESAKENRRRRAILIFAYFPKANVAGRGRGWQHGGLSVASPLYKHLFSKVVQ